MRRRGAPPAANNTPHSYAHIHTLNTTPNKTTNNNAAQRQQASVANLRAIPWIFAWTQTRLILPSWLGFGEALGRAIAEGRRAELRAMYEEWPFFQATIDLIEMCALSMCIYIIAGAGIGGSMHAWGAAGREVEALEGRVARGAFQRGVSGFGPPAPFHHTLSHHTPPPTASSTPHTNPPQHHTTTPP